MADKALRFGAWPVLQPATPVEQADATRQVAARAMDVLVLLCRANGAMVRVCEVNAVGSIFNLKKVEHR